MGVRRDAWLNQTGIKVIRVVIGSHFCAIALGMQVGFDPFFLVHGLDPSGMGQMIAAAALFTLAIAFIFGVMLRVASLILAGFLIFSATLTLFLSADPVSTGPLSQSIALGAAVLLCYGALRPHELHKTALFPVRTLRGAVAREIKHGVSPRRVRPKGVSTQPRPDPIARTFAPLIAPTERMIGVAKEKEVAPKRIAENQILERDDLMEDDVQNIFVNI